MAATALQYQEMRLFAPSPSLQLQQLQSLASQLPHHPSTPYSPHSLDTLHALLALAFPTPALHSNQDYFNTFLALLQPASNFGRALLNYRHTPCPLQGWVSADQLGYLSTCSEVELRRESQAYTLPLLQLWGARLAVSFYEGEREVHSGWYQALGVDCVAQQLHAQPVPHLIRMWSAHLKEHYCAEHSAFLAAVESLLVGEPLAKLTGSLRCSLRAAHLMAAYVLAQCSPSAGSLQLVVGAGEWLEGRERLNAHLLNVWVRVWSGILTASSQWETDHAAADWQRQLDFSWRPSQMQPQLAVHQQSRRLLASLMRTSLVLCKRGESTAHPELAAALSRLLLLETANTHPPPPNSGFAAQLQDQMAHIKHPQAREMAAEAMREYSSRGGWVERRERAMEGGQGLRMRSEVREKNEWAIPVRQHESPFLYLVCRQLASKMDWACGREADGELPRTQLRWMCSRAQYGWLVVAALLYCCWQFCV